MESHQTDEGSQAGSVGLSEQELSSVSGGQFTEEELQFIQKRTKDIAARQTKSMDWRALAPSAFVGVATGFGAHAAGEVTHNAATHH